MTEKEALAYAVLALQEAGIETVEADKVLLHMHNKMLSTQPGDALEKAEAILNNSNCSEKK